jgi:hypothetical protein
MAKKVKINFSNGEKKVPRTLEITFSCLTLVLMLFVVGFHELQCVLLIQFVIQSDCLSLHVSNKIFLAILLCAICNES